MASSKITFNTSKDKKFSEWYSEILNKAEITDIRYGVKGFIVIRPWGAKIMENMYEIYEEALAKTGHQPTFFPIVIPEENFKKEASHVKGFTPEVFWLENKQGEERLALRPTSETAMYQMYSLWVRSHRDLPLKIYHRANVYRYETKATRPLIRGREFYWIETHNCFATKEEAEKQVKEDIQMTEEVMHGIFGIPFLAMKRPQWDKFPGAEYTIGSDCILPDGKIVQQPSTHLLGQHFSKAFNIKFLDEKEKEGYVWQTCYGPAISRIMASVIATHGDDKGLILPYALAPTQVIIVPIIKSGKAGNEKKVLDYSKKIQKQLLEKNISCQVDTSDKRPGDKFFFWEMKGIPFRLEIGQREAKEGKVTISIRDVEKKISLEEKELSKKINTMGKAFDHRLLEKADRKFSRKIISCKSEQDVKKSLDAGSIARFNFCSIEKTGQKCAEFIEKNLAARLMGSRADKVEKPSGNCIFCKKKAGVVAYAAKGY